VIELDTAALSGGSWPDTVPQPHGALLCYDASNDDSFHAVRDVLSEYAADMHVKMLMLCSVQNPRSYFGYQSP
jgi:hypothetical protein